MIYWNTSPVISKYVCKNYSNFLFSSGGSNFKINYLKDKMRYRMLSLYLAEQFGITCITFDIGGQNAMKKQ